MGQLATRNSHDRPAADARRAHLTRAAKTDARAGATDGRRIATGPGASRPPLAANFPTPRVARRRASLVALAALLLFALAPASSRAQSGRRTQPAPTPTPERPRRVPVSDQPGQPATPDAPSSTVARPAASPRPAAGQPSSENPESPEVIDEDEVYHVHSNLVPVSANVSDAAGRAITDLKLEDFELRVDGQPRPISDLSFAETPVRLALLFDNSSSVRVARALEKQAAVRFLRTVLRPGVDQAALFSISTYPSLDHPLTSDVAKLVRTIEGYGDVEGSTALFDTVVAAAEYLRPMPGRKVIVIVSDGVETTSRITDFGEVLRRALAADCQVFVIQTGLSENANLRDLLAERRMQDLTASTGGAVYLPKVAADLDSAFSHISADLSQQYVLSYYPTDDGSDGRFRAISLRVKTRPNMRVRARRGFYPRRRTEASALPANFVLDVAVTAAPEPQPDNSQARDAAPAARGPLHGSKNLSPDDDASADGRPPADARPAVRLGNFDPPDSRGAAAPAPAGARAETGTYAASPVTAPAEKGSAAAGSGAGAESRAGTGAASSSAPPGAAERAEPKPQPSPPAPQPSSELPQSSPPPAAPSQSQQATQTQQQSSTQPARINDILGNGVLNGRATRLPPPQYPETARRARVSGRVSVEVTIDEGGRVISARAVSGPMMLRDAAVYAARQARFSPAMLSGKPVKVTGVINYNFNL